MTLFEVHHSMDRQSAILNEVEQNRRVNEYRKGSPSLGQRTILAVGDALESAGGWMKHRVAPTSPQAAINRGLLVPR